MIVWIMGNAGAGKTTLSDLLIQNRELSHYGAWAQVDGDNIRGIFENKDYSRAGRLKNGDFAIKLCKYLEEQNLNVIVSVITPYNETREKVREAFPEVIMVELYYDYYNNQRREKEKIAYDYEPVPGDDFCLGLDTGKLNTVECITEIKKRF